MDGIKKATKLLKQSLTNLRRIAGSLEAAFAMVFAVIVITLMPLAASASSLTTQNLNEGSPVVLSTAYAAATSAGDSFANDGRTMFCVKNGNGSTMTVTITPGNATRAVPGVGVVTKSTVSVVVPATTGETMIGPFPPAFYNDASGNVNVTYSAVTSVTVAAVRLVLTQ